MQSDRKLIVTADDFGVSLPVNEAVEQAHRDGILSAASLMVGAAEAGDAVARARRLPNLGVGLHLTLINGRPVLPPEEVPGLVGADGRFSNDAVRFGIRLYASGRLRAQVKREIEAQFARFRETGLAMDHINGHRHFHLHPVVLDAIAELAPAFDHPPLRLPYEPYAPSLRANRDRALGRLTGSLFYAAQSRRIRGRSSGGGMKTNDYVFGLHDSGAMSEARVLRLLDHLPHGVTEIYCHPATRRWNGPDAPPASYQPEAEFRALLSGSVKAKLDAMGLRPITYRAAFS